MFLLGATANLALAQLNQNCIVSVLNRTVQVKPDGSWVLPNIPANFGQVRARATCVQNGVTTFGESAFFTVPANGAVNLPAITPGNTNPIPSSLAITPSNVTLTTAGQTVQLVVTATYPGGSTKNVTAASTGTTYTTSNPAIASITPEGLVTAVASGTAMIQATNDGASAIIGVPVALGGDSVGGIPVSWLISNHLNQYSPTVASEDPDRDGLTNLQEFQIGTDPTNRDTDGDGLSDGDEVNTYHTNPLLADTDGDSIPDGVEVQTATNPLDKNSYDLKKATAVSTLTPPTFILSTSSVTPNVSQQLIWTVKLIDGKTTLDLTNDARTNYSSSNLQVCNFGGQKGQVFAGSIGTCTITVSQNTLSATASGTVQSFTPTEVSAISIAGAVAVDVGGTFAYVATGTNGLTVVDVTNRTQPRIRGTLASLGNAQGVRVSGSNAFIADANGLVRVVSVQNPDAPALVTSFTVTGSPIALALHGNVLAVAAQAGGVSLIDITTPAAPMLLAAFGTQAAAIGVDFDLQQNLAAIAMGTGGLQIVNIADLRAPVLRGLLGGGNVRRVLMKYPAVLLADTQRSVSAVNITNPDAPVLTASLNANLAGTPVDIASFAGIAITADTSFGRAIPVIDVSNPLQPNALTFWTPASAGFGSSIAMDGSFGYLVMSTNSTLRIYQYRQIIDLPGTPPTVQITSPATGTTVIYGSTVTATAVATDDVGVVSVSFSINGQPAFTTSQTPYQYTFTVPSAGSTLTIGAVATDFANDTAAAQPVTLNTIPDPLTTVTGKVTDSDSNPISGSTVVTAGGRSAISVGDGSFSIPSVPTALGNITVTATYVRGDGTVLAGNSAPVVPILGGVTPVGTIILRPKPAITSVAPKIMLAGTTATLTVKGTNLTGATFAFALSNGALIPSINSVSIDGTGTTATLSVTIPSSVTAYCTVLAVNNVGTSNSTPIVGFLPTVISFNTFSIPGSSAAADPDNDGLSNAQEITSGTDPLNAETDGDMYPDGLEVALGSNPLSASSIPVILRPPGEATAKTASVLNSVISTVNAAIPREATGRTLSILNGSLTSVSTPIAREADGKTVSILNGILTSSTSPISREARSVSISIQNLVSSSKISSALALELRDLLSGTPPHSNPISNPHVDTDGDGISDELENLLGTDPLKSDTDGDGFPDGLEIALGTDPRDKDSMPVLVHAREATAVNVSVEQKGLVPAEQIPGEQKE